MAAPTDPMIGPKRTPQPGHDDRTLTLSSAIARTRGDMEDTLEELHGRLNPSLLKDDVLTQFRETKEIIKVELRGELAEAKEAVKASIDDTVESLKAAAREANDELVSAVKSELSEAKQALHDATIGKVNTMIENTERAIQQTGRTFIDTIKSNPIPATMIGVGLVWMFARSRSDSALGRFASNTTASVGEAAHTASATLTQAAHDAKASIGVASHKVADKVTGLAHDAAERGRQLGAKAESTYEAHPLAVGAAVLAAGATLGLVLPMSQREEKWMGAASNEALHKAEDLASDAIHKVGHVAKELATPSTHGERGSKRPTDGKIDGESVF